MSASRDLSRAFKKIKRFLNVKAFSNKEMRVLGDRSVELIVKRTRAGKGVEKTGGKSKSLKSMRKHSPLYTAFRKKNKRKLSKFTAPARHNLTLSGDMLDALKVTHIKKGKVTIGFNKNKEETKAEVNAKRGWKFNNLSSPEIKQLTRFYRRTFGDLVKKNLT